MLRPAGSSWNTIRNSTLVRVEQVPIDKEGTRHEINRSWYEHRLLTAAAECEATALLCPAFFTPVTRNLPTLVTVHDLAFERYPERFTVSNLDLYRQYGRESALKADAVLTVSRSTARDVIDLWGIPPARVVVTALGPTVRRKRHRRFDPVAKPPGRSFGVHDRYLIVVSPDHPRKNLHHVVREFLMLRERTRADLSLLLVNAENEYTREILRASGSAGIVVTGRLKEEQLRDLIEGAVALVHGSVSEGFGLPVLNAMVLGTPVIINNAPALNEVAAGAGLLVDVQTEGQLAAAIESIAFDDAVLAQMACAGREVARQYTWGRAVERTLTTLAETVAGQALTFSVEQEFDRDASLKPDPIPESDALNMTKIP